MLARLRHPDLRPVVAALFAVAMVWLGLGHRPIETRPGSSAGLVVLAALPDGTVAELCALAPADAPQSGAHAGRCDACLLALMPATVGAAARAVPSVEGTGAVAAATLVLVAQLRPPRPPSRAPPLA